MAKNRNIALIISLMFALVLGGSTAMSAYHNSAPVESVEPQSFITEGFSGQVVWRCSATRCWYEGTNNEGSSVVQVQPDPALPYDFRRLITEYNVPYDVAIEAVRSYLWDYHSPVGV